MAGTTVEFDQTPTTAQVVIHRPVKDTTVLMLALNMVRGVVHRLNADMPAGDIEISIRFVPPLGDGLLSDVNISDYEPDYDDTDPPDFASTRETELICHSVYVQKKGRLPGFSYVLKTSSNDRIVMYSGDALRKAGYPVDDWKLKGVGREYPLRPQAFVTAHMAYSKTGHPHWVVNSVQQA